MVKSFRKYKDDSPVAFAWSLNRERRHMTKSRLANTGVKMLPALKEEAKKRQGQRTDLNNIPVVLRESPKGEAVEHAGKKDPTGELREGVKDEAKEGEKVPEYSGTLKARPLNT